MNATADAASRSSPATSPTQTRPNVWSARSTTPGSGWRGVLHSATVLDDEIVLNMSESAVARVFAPKVTGGWRLHEATADRDLDWWLTFSSAASLLGSPGQGAYAAANSWVDGLVAYRRCARVACGRNQLGPVGGSRAWPVLRRPRLLDDHAGTGLAAIQLVLGRRPVSTPACSASMRGNGSSRSQPRPGRRCSAKLQRRRPPLSDRRRQASEPSSTRSIQRTRPLVSRRRSPTRSGPCCVPVSRSITTTRWSRSASTR